MQGTKILSSSITNNHVKKKNEINAIHIWLQKQDKKKMAHNMKNVKSFKDKYLESKKFFKFNQKNIVALDLAMMMIMIWCDIYIYIYVWTWESLRRYLPRVNDTASSCKVKRVSSSSVRLFLVMTTHLPFGWADRCPNRWKLICALAYV